MPNDIKSFIASVPERLVRFNQDLAAFHVKHAADPQKRLEAHQLAVQAAKLAFDVNPLVNPPGSQTNRDALQHVERMLAMEAALARLDRPAVDPDDDDDDDDDP